MRDRPIPHAHKPKPPPKINYPPQNDQPNTCGGSRLSDWWPESEIGETCAGIVRPDAYGEYTDHDRTLAFFFEYDTGTETLDTLVEKIGKYTELADAGIRRPILFHLPSTSREHHLHQAVTRRWPIKPPVPVATLPADQLAPPGHSINPDRPSVVDALWLPVGHTRRRTLAELAQTRPSTQLAAA